jgi:hypothetical protein
MLIASVLVPAAAQADAATPSATTFNYTGAAQTWTVPSGVNIATFDVFGAQGGSGGGCTCSGGPGGEITATLRVTPGTILQINGGGAGASITPTNQGSWQTGVGGSGGFNGGGNGGYGGSTGGGGGGGASDVRSGGFSLTERLLVAGGGGGAAGLTNSNGGGGGGGTTGGSGVGYFQQGWNATGGGGGTQTAGGAGGTNQYEGSFPGSFGQGSSAPEGLNGGTFAGGGGGGGYYGGGAGNYLSGGGGGSGYTNAASGTFHTGVRSGNGQVTITYTVTTPRTAVTYNPTGPQCSCTALPAASVASGFTASALSQVGFGGWGNTDVWPVGQIGPSSSINLGEYLTFSVTPNVPTIYTSLSLTEQSYVGQGPRNAVVRTSLDGFTTNIASVTGLNPAGVNQIAFNLASLPIASGQVEFRVYYFNAPSTGQDWADLVSTNRAGATGLILTGDLP